MNRLLLQVVALAFSWLLTGCSKSENDFVGTYSTYYATRIEIADVFFHLKDVTTARTFNDLGEIKLNVFVDKQKRSLAGEAVFYLKMGDNSSVEPDERTQEIDLDLSNFHLNGDTLEFSIDNQLFKNTGRRITGKLVRVGEVTVVGLGKDMVTFAEMKTSPFYISQVGNFVFYNCYDEATTNAKVRAYFLDQESQLVNKIKSESNLKKRHAFENIEMKEYRNESCKEKTS